LPPAATRRPASSRWRASSLLASLSSISGTGGLF